MCVCVCECVSIHVCMLEGREEVTRTAVTMVVIHLVVEG